MNLDRFLVNTGISVNQFAEALGYSAQYIGHIVRKKRYPSFDLAAKIESITDGKVTVEELLDRPIRKRCPLCKSLLSANKSLKIKSDLKGK